MKQIPSGRLVVNAPGLFIFGMEDTKVLTWLCPHCDQTHLTIHNEDATINFKLSIPAAEALAAQLLNPEPADPKDIDR